MWILLSALTGGLIVRLWYEHFVVPAIVWGAMTNPDKINPPPKSRRRAERIGRLLSRRNRP
ncbi:hypothetical protein HMPREF9946_03128 [Acetobacteraceae bacterium AT-5844]|nr:hypothetical protein HMPREF9946_03128 [Acetobacteraceae bacterium AT-5844]